MSTNGGSNGSDGVSLDGLVTSVQTEMRIQSGVPFHRRMANRAFVKIVIKVRLDTGKKTWISAARRMIFVDIYS